MLTCAIFENSTAARQVFVRQAAKKSSSNNGQAIKRGGGEPLSKRELKKVPMAIKLEGWGVRPQLHGLLWRNFFCGFPNQRLF